MDAYRYDYGWEMADERILKERRVEHSEIDVDDQSAVPKHDDLNDVQ